MGDLRALAARHNLQRIINFYHVVRGCMREAIDTAEMDERDKILVEARCDDFEGALRINTFLMLYSHLEEWLALLTKKYGSAHALPRGASPTRSGLLRYKEVLRAVFDADTGGSEWAFLVESQKIRHCLLHANGRIDLMNNASELERLAAKHALVVQNKRLALPTEFLSAFAKSAGRFVLGLLETTKVSQDE